MRELPFINTQKPMHRECSDDGSLSVFKIFHTVQGEGPFAGHRATFIRLVGCNLMCPLCDTDYTSNARTMSLDDIIIEVNDVSKVESRLYEDNHSDAPPNIGTSSLPLVVITGGEPFRQNIIPLCCELVSAGFTVQVETNGTLINEEWQSFVNTTAAGLKTHTVVSPKTPRVSKWVFGLSNLYWKYVVEAGYTCPHDGLPTNVLGLQMRVQRPWGFVPKSDAEHCKHLTALPNDNIVSSSYKVYIQPVDMHDASDDGSTHLQEVVKSALGFGYILSLQSHKMAGLE